MIILYTGDGKGKTTAALGAALRAMGNGAKVIMFQFIKGPWLSGEDHLFEKIKNQKSLAGQAKVKNKLINGLENFYNFQIIKGGKGFVGILGDKLPISEHKKAAKQTLNQALKAAQSRKYDVIILDEVNVAVSLKLLTVRQVLDLIKKSKDIDFILTGRNAPKEFYEIADIISEIKSIKHRFDKGKLAKKGLEY